VWRGRRNGRPTSNFEQWEIFTSSAGVQPTRIGDRRLRSHQTPGCERCGDASAPRRYRHEWHRPSSSDSRSVSVLPAEGMVFLAPNSAYHVAHGLRSGGTLFTPLVVDMLSRRECWFSVEEERIRARSVRKSTTARSVEGHSGKAVPSDVRTGREPDAGSKDCRVPFSSRVGGSVGALLYCPLFRDRFCPCQKNLP